MPRGRFDARHGSIRDLPFLRQRSSPARAETRGFRPGAGLGRAANARRAIERGPRPFDEEPPKRGLIFNGAFVLPSEDTASHRAQHRQGRALRVGLRPSLDRACARRPGQSSGRDEGMLTSVDAVRQPNQPLNPLSTSSQGAPKQLMAKSVGIPDRAKLRSVIAHQARRDDRRAWPRIPSRQRQHEQAASKARTHDRSYAFAKNVARFFLRSGGRPHMTAPTRSPKTLLDSSCDPGAVHT